MQRFLAVPPVVVLALALGASAAAGPQLTAQPAAPAQAQPPAPVAKTGADAVRRIPVLEAKEAIEKGQAIVVDVRSKAEYDAGHVKGALSIPSFEIDSRFSELPKGKLIITYCT
ncbi:MAG TPA: rhodanese-like domain-containing protein [Thermoanaerobaculia bacterium]|nr:rhodanese-like domain-containing protein [Thermoanaerobaculia bacterium]